MTVFAAVFVALYAGHQIGDHVAQTDHMAANKASGKPGALPAMLAHVGSYLACQAVALGAVALAFGHLALAGGLLALMWSGSTHMFIDLRWPVRWLLNHTGSRGFASRIDGAWPTGMYQADQALHIGCLFAAALVAGAL